MTDIKTVMSWLEGLAQDDWRDYHSDSEIQEIATRALAMLKEQEERIGVLTRAIEQMPKPTKLLDVYRDGYAKVVRCKNCKYAKPMCQPWDDIVCTKNSAAHDTYWFCADGERKQAEKTVNPG